MHVVRTKLFKPGEDNFGTRWVEVPVTDYGAGVVRFGVYRPAHWTKFRVATQDNGRILQEHMIRPGDTFGQDDVEGIHVEPGDVVTVDFVVHELAFRIRLNDDPDDDDVAVLQLYRLQQHLKGED